ncbi:MAG TPA: glycosyltransferase family A protein, partial [Coriobacteriia bacterium]
MDQQPDVSVIVAAYNGMPYIERMLASLVRQTIGLAHMQVLVVDDGSTDETPAVLDQTAAAHPSFEIIHQPNFGRPAGPRNRALKSVRGRYVFFLDQDDYLSDDALETMVRTADVNGTDVVLARMKGVGGRGTQRTMFARTIPRTDVHSCSAYWTLNPMKLFRAEMVRSLGLQFAEDSPWGEDEPFVAMAYLKGAGISILADRDYVYWVYRDDLSNITTSVLALADRMPVVDRMFDLVAANVPPGPERDRLMQRHFRVELGDSAFEGYRTELDLGLRVAAFRRFREIVDAYYTERIESALPVGDRVLMRLISEGRADEFA